MQNKLQELTDKLYQEGLSKGKKDGEELKEKAKTEAAKIISEAKQEAKKIIETARKEGEDIKLKANNDLKLASTQTISAIKQEIERVIIAKVIDAPTNEVLSDKEFLGSIIKTVISSFNAAYGTSVPLEIILSANTKHELHSYFEQELSSFLGEGTNISFSKQVNSGFKIGPKNGTYIISFTDNDFEQLLSNYLRPYTKKLLFG
jgi:V/A-type H+/Na+-transporting ATPase subunit E